MLYVNISPHRLLICLYFGYRPRDCYRFFSFETQEARSDDFLYLSSRLLGGCLQYQSLSWCWSTWTTGRYTKHTRGTDHGKINILFEIVLNMHIYWNMYYILRSVHSIYTIIYFYIYRHGFKTSDHDQTENVKDSIVIAVFMLPKDLKVNCLYTILHVSLH